MVHQRIRIHFKHLSAQIYRILILQLYLLEPALQIIIKALLFLFSVLSSETILIEQFVVCHLVIWEYRVILMYAAVDCVGKHCQLLVLDRSF